MFLNNNADVTAPNMFQTTVQDDLSRLLGFGLEEFYVMLSVPF